MTKAIIHLEDAAFFLTPHELMELMSALIMHIGARQRIGDLTIKYDGTCLVFGNQDGFFISDQGYFNKTPRRFRSLDEIYEYDVSPDKKSKLLTAFTVLQKETIRPELVLHADWLFDGLTVKNNSFQPNVVRYSSRSSLDGYRLGLAVHSQIYCGIDAASQWTGKQSDVFWAPSLLKGLLEFNGYEKLYQLVGNINPKEYQLEIPTIKELRKELNNSVREHDYYDFGHLNKFFAKGLNSLAFNLDMLVRLKYLLLVQLNRSAEEDKIFEMSIGPEPAPHEGFVFRFKHYKIKLVDRYRFSKKNFDMTTNRGWYNGRIRLVSDNTKRTS